MVWLEGPVLDGTGRIEDVYQSEDKRRNGEKGICEILRDERRWIAVKLIIENVDITWIHQETNYVRTKKERKGYLEKHSNRLISCLTGINKTIMISS